jgi:hypothetical protein
MRNPSPRAAGKPDRNDANGVAGSEIEAALSGG